MKPRDVPGSHYTQEELLLCILEELKEIKEQGRRRSQRGKTDAELYWLEGYAEWRERQTEEGE